MELPLRRCWPMPRMAMKLSFGNSLANWVYRMLLACAGPRRFGDLEKLHSRQNQEAGWGAHRNCCAGIENINRFLSNKWLSFLAGQGLESGLLASGDQAEIALPFCGTASATCSSGLLAKRTS